MRAYSLEWYVNRLKAMNISEIYFRIVIAFRKKLWRIKMPNYSVHPDVSKTRYIDGFVDVLSPLLKTHEQELISEAEDYLNHRWLFFGLNKNENKIDWHFDPQYGVTAPLVFGFSINHRSEVIVGNIKNIWEKNRHHHLTVLSSAYYLTGDERYSTEVKHQLESWINQNPYLVGVNWTHPLEQGIRLISWVYLFHLLKGSEHYDYLFGKEGVLWKSIFEHQKFIELTYSRGSSANNHLIGEMAGLYMASKIWPVFTLSEKWKKLSLEILEKELVRQTYNDGVNKELAFSYQIFVLEFTILAFGCDPIDFTDRFKETLTKEKQVVDQLTQILGSQPNYGDGDEGMALQVLPYGSNRLNWISVLFDKWGFNTGSLDQSLFISEEAGISAFRWNVGDETFRVLFDFGPLGMGSMAAHGHADALAFTLTVDETPVMVDPGTFCYHDNLTFRSYFRSTLAHNTLSIDRKDQSSQAGPFLWVDHAECKLERFDFQGEVLSIKACHNGYLKSYGVTHHRTLDAGSEGIEITDKLDGDVETEVVLTFHFHPDVNVWEIKKGLIGIKSKMVYLELKYDQRFSVEIVKGHKQMGWHSPAFGTKVKSCTLVLSQMLSLPTEIKTEITKKL